MGYCGIKIPGHSGTDFKHKKAYKESKQLLNAEQSFVDIRLEPRESYRTYSPLSLPMKIITIISILAVTALLSLFIYKSATVSIHKNSLSNEYLRSIELQQNIEAAEMLYNSAQLYFKSGALNEAQYEINLVLNLYPKNREAIQLMYEILDKQCEVNHQFCDEASAYDDYLKAVNPETTG